MLFEQEIQTWPKHVVSKVASHEMYQHKIHIHSLNTCESNKNSKIITLKVILTYTMCGFFQVRMKSIEIQYKSGFYSIFGKTVSKGCHFSLTEVTVIIKIHSFLIANKRATVACLISFWYKANY